MSGHIYAKLSESFYWTCLCVFDKNTWHNFLCHIHNNKKMSYLTAKLSVFIISDHPLQSSNMCCVNWNEKSKHLLYCKRIEKKIYSTIYINLAIFYYFTIITISYTNVSGDLFSFWVALPRKPKYDSQLRNSIHY